MQEVYKELGRHLASETVVGQFGQNIQKSIVEREIFFDEKRIYVSAGS